jgi:hypothetical protein
VLGIWLLDVIFGRYLTGRPLRQAGAPRSASVEG